MALPSQSDRPESKGEEAMTDRSQRITELERRIAQLRASLPKHSTSMALMLELDEAEDALDALRGQQATEDGAVEQ